jgi:hypothetical protein
MMRMAKRRSSIAAGAVLAAAISGAAWATPVEDLVARGFVVVKDTSISGDFDGCDHDLKVPLTNGGTFTCAGFSYMHAHNPKAVLLKQKGGAQYKLVVGNVVFDGTFA